LNVRRRGGGPGCLPLIWQELGEPAGGVGTDAVEDIAQIDERIDVEELAGGEEAGQDGGRPASGVAAEEDPVLATHSHPSQAALGPVVVDLQVTVLGVAEERRPVAEGIGNGFANPGHSL